MADQDGPQQRPIRIEEGGSFPLSKFTSQRGSRSRANVVALHEQAGRVPPQAVDVEQSVLGAMLIEREAIPKAIEILPAEAFYDARHQRVYQAMLGLFERGNPVDLITLTEELKRRGEFENIGGYYLSELTTRVASAANVEYHARIIAEKSLLRQMIETMTTTVGEAYDPSTDAFDLLDRAERDIFQISESQLRKSSRSMSEVVMETFKQLEALSHRDGGITGVPSGFHALDNMTGGWQKSDLVIIAARPSMGKTAFSLATAMNAATHPQYGVGVAIFSLEMSANQLAQRMLTSEARIDAQKARTGRLTDEDWPLLARAAGRLEAAKIFVDDTPGLGILELRAKCRRLKAEHDIGMVIVDYLQLMHGTRDSRNANREQEIAQISRSLKGLAKELDVPVIALAQLSRAVETRGGDKRPQLSDLRESGCLTGDTLVTRADTGARVPIRDLAAHYPNGGFDAWALDPQTLKLVAAPVSRAFSTGTKPVFRLTTRLGRAVRATANHKFLTIEGWKRLDELIEGERLALPHRIEQPETATRSEDTNHDVIPKLVWERLVVPAMGRAGLTTRQMQADLGMSYCGSTLYKTNLSRARAARVAEVVGSLTLLRLAESDVYWDEIVSVEPDGVEEVYDLTVPGPHNFVADDVIVHNSIEQDADVVAFIYRAERYGITQDENGNSTAGLGEIIIGKQRNGPIGNVRLAFVNQYARFENLTTYYGNDPGYEFNASPPPLPGAGGGYDDYEELPPPGDAPF